MTGDDRNRHTDESQHRRRVGNRAGDRRDNDVRRAFPLEARAAREGEIGKLDEYDRGKSRCVPEATFPAR